MKDYLARLVQQAPPSVDARNIVREYLQARILGSLQRAGAMAPLAFHGGTALRFLFAMLRYSEDLDFALERPDGGYDLREYLAAIETEMSREGYAPDIKVNDRKVVHAAVIRFPGLLFELGVSPHSRAVLAVKIEVDTRPPAGAVLETTVVRRFVTLNLQHHDRASLLAGKLAAVLARPYLKGRDLYDLVWYLADPDWPAPNLELLNNALAQEGWSGTRLAERNWRSVVRDRLSSVDWEDAAADVRPFLEDAADTALLSESTVMRLLG